MPHKIILKSHFDKHDKDGSGLIEIQEFADMCYDVGFHLDERQTKIAFDAMDKDQTGKIRFSEFEDWARTTSMFDAVKDGSEAFETIMEYPEWMEWLIETFRWYDVDKSGSISPDEFKRLCDDFPFKAPSAWKQVDEDGDGSVSFNEFMHWVWHNYDSFLGHKDDLVSAAGAATTVMSVRLPMATALLHSKVGLKRCDASLTAEVGGDSEAPAASSPGEVGDDSVVGAIGISESEVPSVAPTPGVIWVDWKAAAYERSNLNSVSGITFKGFHDDKKAPDYVPPDQWIKYILECADDPGQHVVAAILNRSHMQQVRDIRTICTTLGCESPAFVICTGRGRPEEFAKYGIEAEFVTKDWNRAAEIALNEVRKKYPALAF